MFKSFSKNWTQLICVWPPYRGGMGRVAVRLAELIPTLKTITPKYSQQKYLPDFRVDFVKPKLAIGNAAILNDLDQKLKSVEALLLHYPFFGVLSPVLRWKSKFPERPLIIWYHMDPVASDWRQIIFSLVRKFYLPQLINAADKVICSTADYAANSDLSLNNYQTKFEAIPFSLPDQIWVENKNHRSRNSQVKFLFVGTLDRAHDFKGLGELIKVWTKLPNDCSLTIIGEGPDKVYYQNLAKGLKIFFLSGVGDSALRTAYGSHDFVIINSINRVEAFSLVALEAQALGTPVIAANWPGVRVVAQNTDLLFKANSESELFAKIKFASQASAGQWKVWSDRARIESKKLFADSVIRPKLINLLN